jgi:ABC-type transport system substrate-binding protein
MTTSSYWNLLQTRIRRRSALAAGAGFGLAVSTAALIGCGGDDKNTSKTGGDSSSLLYKPVDTSSSATKGGVFPQVSTQDIASFDAINNATDATHALLGYSRLTKYAPVVYPKAPVPTAVPDAMKSWEVSPDGTTYTYKVRPNMKYDPRPPTNGRTMTSADVKYSWERFAQLNPTNANLAHAVDPSGPIESISTPDAETATFKLAYPYAPLNLMLGYERYIPILPTEAESQFDVRHDMRGTGPWRLKEFVPSASVTYDKNPDWYDASKVFVDGLKFFVIPEYATGLAQFRTGAFGTFVVQQTDILTAKKDVPALQVLQNLEYVKSSNGIHFGYLPGSPFLDERVRQATSMLLDRDLLLETINNSKQFTDAGLDAPIRWNSALGAGLEGSWLDPKDQKNFGDGAKYFKHDPEEAKKLLSATGQTLPISVPYTLTSYYGDAYMNEGLIMKDMLESSGDFKLNIQDVDYRTVFRTKYRYGSSKYDGMVWFGAGGEDYPDPDGFLLALYLSGQDRTGHLAADGSVDKKLDNMILGQRQIDDAPKRTTALHDLQRYLAEKMYILPSAGSSLGFQMAQPWVGNWGFYSAITAGSPWSEANIYWWLDNSKK